MPLWHNGEHENMVAAYLNAYIQHGQIKTFARTTKSASNSRNSNQNCFGITHIANTKRILLLLEST